MSDQTKSSLIQRINFRVILFAATLLFLLGWPIYTFLAETLTHGVHDRGNYKEVDLKALGFFRFDPYTSTPASIPTDFRVLDGQKVMLNGLIIAPQEARSSITAFTLQYSPESCCGFGGPPQVQEKVYATASPGRMLQYKGNVRYDVFGTLHLTMKRGVAGDVIEVYHLDAESMTPQR